MPLAAVGVFAMALGVLATLNLGQAVHQKIKLQNTADSAAYTLAVMEARTFNYFAFLNRAQIAHYNTAMVVQSYVSFMGYSLVVHSIAVDLVKALKNATETGSKMCCTPPYCTLGCPYIAALPGVSAAASSADQNRQQMFSRFKQAEKLGHEITDAMSRFNFGTVWVTGWIRGLQMLAHIGSAMSGYIKELDKDLRFFSGGVGELLFNTFMNIGLNGIAYCGVFDAGAGFTPCFAGMKGKGYLDSTDDKQKDAVRVMAELSHATRSPSFVSDRSKSMTFPLVPSAMMYAPTFFGKKGGQTKMTSRDSMVGAKVLSIGSDRNYVAAKYISSDDFASSGAGSAGPAMPSAAVVGFKATTSLGDAISTYKDSIKHFIFDSFKGAKGSGAVITFPFGKPEGYTASNSCKPKWKGLAWHFKFKPNPKRTADYGQPSTWIFLNKHHEIFQTKGGSHQSKKAPWYGKWQMDHGKKRMELDTTIGGKKSSHLAKLVKLEGLNVISRGMVYYHRPGNWTEHPNFYNPFWRARLAPVGQKLQNFWDSAVSSNISTSSDNMIIKGAVNMLKNAQMDGFTAIVTSIITH